MSTVSTAWNVPGSSAAVTPPMAGVAVPRRPRTKGSWVRLLGHIGWNLPRSGWTLLDASGLVAGLWIGYVLFAAPVIRPYPHVELWQALLVYGCSLVAASLIVGLSEREALLSRSTILTRILLTIAIATVLTYALLYGLMYCVLSRRVAACAVAGYFATAIPARLCACWALSRMKRNVLLVGSEPTWDLFQSAIKEGHFSRYRFVGFVSPPQITNPQHGLGGCLGSTDDIAALSQQHTIADIVVSTESARAPEIIPWLLAGLYNGCRVTLEAAFFEKATGQIPLQHLNSDWFLLADLKAHCEEYSALKRAMDLLLAVVGLLLTLPLWPVIALLIKLADGGPAFYAQDRVGQHGHIFRLFKFRTMRVNAEPNGPQWATRTDDRVTWIGRFLRRSRLDELPQLYNILRGDMSVVGPRPERPEFVIQLSNHLPFYNERHLVRPGLTGWAQIGFRYGNSIEDSRRKLQFDIYYLKHMSMELDMVILFRTLGVFLRGSC